nr:MAG TPA: hypothetical protein [Bacteriophage sp.]
MGVRHSSNQKVCHKLISRQSMIYLMMTNGSKNRWQRI